MTSPRYCLVPKAGSPWYIFVPKAASPCYIFVPKAGSPWYNFVPRAAIPWYIFVPRAAIPWYIFVPRAASIFVLRADPALIPPSLAAQQPSCHILRDRERHRTAEQHSNSVKVAALHMKKAKVKTKKIFD